MFHSATPSDQNLTTQYVYSSGSGVSSVSQLEANSASSTVAVTSTVVSGGGSYLMYSANAPDTSPGGGANATGSGDVVSVRYQGGWQYCQVCPWQAVWVQIEGQWVEEVEETPVWTSFAPRPDDVIIATISESSPYYSLLVGDTGTLDGIQYGYASSSGLSITYSPAATTYWEGYVYGYTPAEYSVAGTVVPNALAQVTSYLYGPLPSDGSDYAPTDSASEVVYPGSFYDSQTDTVTGSDYVQYTYDQIGEMTSMTDQNGTTHEYAYDGEGHLLSDTATVAWGNPHNIDTAVASIDYAYKVCGRLASVSSEDASGNVLNEILYQYDSNGNLVDEYQCTAGRSKRPAACTWATAMTTPRSRATSSTRAAITST